MLFKLIECIMSGISAIWFILKGTNDPTQGRTSTFNQWMGWKSFPAIHKSYLYEFAYIVMVSTLVFNYVELKVTCIEHPIYCFWYLNKIWMSLRMKKILGIERSHLCIETKRCPHIYASQKSICKCSCAHKSRVAHATCKDYQTITY